jgi:cellobiose PTS system EIIA component
MDEDNSVSEDLAMEIIANSGAARSAAEEGLAAAKKGDFVTAHSKMKEAGAALKLAHGFHSQLLKLGASGQQETVLMAHAQDHVMTTMLAVDLIGDIIDLYEANSNK